MQEFLTVQLPTIILSLVSGGIGAYFSHYISEKGKNLATKEDIESITRKMESTKHKSTALIERKIKTFDEISANLGELQIVCLREIQESEHAVPYEPLRQMSLFQRAVHLAEINQKQKIYLSQEISDKISDLVDDVFLLGHTEMTLQEFNAIDKDGFNKVRQKANLIMTDMRHELFDE